MKRAMTWILALVLTLGLCACGDSSAKWQEQYDLGQKYLTEGNYEEAILAFTAAIEIDPKNALAYVGRGDAYLGRGSDEESLTAAFADFETALSLDDTNAGAYLGLAEVYIARDQFDEAMDILRQGVEKTGDQRLADRLAELKSGNISDYWGRRLKETHYDGNGALTCWYEYEYNDQGQCIGITSYGPDGNQVQHMEQRYDAQGHMVYGRASWDDDGEMRGMTQVYNSAGRLEKTINDAGGTVIYTYDSEGKENRRDFCDAGGSLTGYMTREYGEGFERCESYDANGAMTSYLIEYYDQQGRRVREEYYDADGTLKHYDTEIYDEDGDEIAWEHYDADGNLTGRDVYN